jgi:hypothetical protein
MEMEVRQIEDGDKLKKQKTAKWLGLRTVPNDWQYFWPTLVFAEHDL